MKHVLVHPITHQAFACCTSLKEIEMPGIIRIHSEAFLDCRSLENVKIMKDVKADADSFKGVPLSWKLP